MNCFSCVVQRGSASGEKTMMTKAKRILGFVGVCALLMGGSTGCIKSMLLNGQIESTRKASPAIDTLGDYEVARGTIYGSVGTLEGLHRLAPSNPNGLFLLTKSWSGIGTGFIEDDWEVAVDAGREDEAEAHRTRARGAYTRAVFYGLELLKQKADGFEAARRNATTMRAWLKKFDKDDVPDLFWTGFAWLSRVNVSKDFPELVSELDVGVAMLERVVELDETYNFGLAHVALGSYHARSPMAEMDQARAHFEKALKINGGKALLTKFHYARTYHCFKNDKQSYVSMMKQVIDAGDPLPEQRLQNTMAQRRAKRYLKESRMGECGF